MPSKRYNYKQVQMRFDNIGLCCFGSCLSLLSSTLTHVHTLNTAQALQYKYKYADESKYIQTCLEFAQFSAHSLYLVEMNRARYPIWFGTFKMCGHRGIANLWIKLENKGATGNISFLLLLNIAIIKIHLCTVSQLVWMVRMLSAAAAAQTEQTDQIYFPSERFLFPPPRLNYPT